MDTETKRVPKGHRWFAATYDTVTRWSERKLLSQLHARTTGEATGTVLEVGAGCHLNRRTTASIEAAGFEIVDLEHKQTPLMPIIFGWARPRKA